MANVNTFVHTSLISSRDLFGNAGIVLGWCEKGRVASYKGPIYYLMRSLGDWRNLASFEAIVEILQALDIKNATVNYTAAITPYISLFKTNAVIVESLPISTCIGRHRYEIRKEGDQLIAAPCQIRNSTGSTICWASPP
jgi:hypothetical protein